MAGKVTDKQLQHLQALSGSERAAYPGLHMGVLNSLSLRGLVAARRDLGSGFAPRNNIIWRITPAGRAHLASSGKDD